MVIAEDEPSRRKSAHASGKTWRRQSTESLPRRSHILFRVILNLQLYNNVTHACLRILKLCSMGRNYFDPNAEVALPPRSIARICKNFESTVRIFDLLPHQTCLSVCFIASSQTLVRAELNPPGVSDGFRLELHANCPRSSYTAGTGLPGLSQRKLWVQS